MTIAPEKALSPYRIAANGYEEAVRITEAQRIQLGVRKRALIAAKGNKAMAHKCPEMEQRLEEAEGWLESAERAEYAAWCRMEHARQGR